MRLLTRDSESRIEKAPKETIAELILDNIARSGAGPQRETRAPVRAAGAAETETRGAPWRASPPVIVAR